MAPVVRFVPAPLPTPEAQYATLLVNQALIMKGLAWLLRNDPEAQAVAKGLDEQALHVASMVGVDVNPVIRDDRGA